MAFYCATSLDDIHTGHGMSIMGHLLVKLRFNVEQRNRLQLPPGAHECASAAHVVHVVHVVVTMILRVLGERQ